jgi:hypothetical protein
MNSPNAKAGEVSRRKALVAIGETGVGVALGSSAPSTERSDGMEVAPTAASSEILRHGAYVSLRVPGHARRIVAAAAVPTLIGRLGLRNEFDAVDGHPTNAVAFLRRVDATPADIEDHHLLHSDAVIHVASPTAERVTAFCVEVDRLLGPAVKRRVLSGVVRPTNYTGNAMHDFAYAHQVTQQPGGVMPNAFLLPMGKAPAWWAKDWMERHTYFLPRYDESGRMVNQGHALAAAAGIPCLMRRTYKHATLPAPEGAYDFVNYFECADAHIPTFHEVCRALRETTKNPEWRFVREGPTWHGRRVATWPELFE